MNIEKFKNNSKRYNTPYGDVLINHTIKNIGIRLSGGFDSAVMLYAIAHALTETKSIAQIYPMTIRRTNSSEYFKYDRVDSYLYADAVAEYVKAAFPNVIIHPAIKEDANYWWAADHIDGKNISSYTNAQQNLARYNKWKFTRSNRENDEVLYIDYTGTTKNPIGTEVPPSEESHRDYNRTNIVCDEAVTTLLQDASNEHVVYVEPFRNADKRITMWLADSFSILEDLLIITKSCEGGPVETNGFTKECGLCWWCLEKKWAANNYKIKDRTIENN